MDTFWKECSRSEKQETARLESVWAVVRSGRRLRRGNRSVRSATQQTVAKSNSRVAEVDAGADTVDNTGELRVHSTKITIIGDLIVIFDLKNAAAVKRRPRTATHGVHARLCIVHLAEPQVDASYERATERRKTWNHEETHFRMEPALINRSIG